MVIEGGDLSHYFMGVIYIIVMVVIECGVEHE